MAEPSLTLSSRSSPHSSSRPSRVRPLENCVLLMKDDFSRWVEVELMPKAEVSHCVKVGDTCPSSRSSSSYIAKGIVLCYRHCDECCIVGLK